MKTVPILAMLVVTFAGGGAGLTAHAENDVCDSVQVSRPAYPEDPGNLDCSLATVAIAVPRYILVAGEPYAIYNGVLDSVQADLYVPEGGPWPLVELSHGMNNNKADMTGWGRILASRGFVVIIADRRTDVGGPSLDRTTDYLSLDAYVNSEDMLTILRWAVNQGTVAGSPLHGKVDSRRLGIGGHSLGGYYATLAAARSQTEGPTLSALALLDPANEAAIGQHLVPDLDTDQVAGRLKMPTLVLASEENGTDVKCDEAMGGLCSLNAHQEFAALPAALPRLGVKVLGATHNEVEDPDPEDGANTSQKRQSLFKRYADAWLGFWLQGDCTTTPYLNGRASAADQGAQFIVVFYGSSPGPSCHRRTASAAES